MPWRFHVFQSVVMLCPPRPVFVNIFLSPKNYSKWEEK